MRASRIPQARALGVARPHLLPVDHPAVAVALGTRAHRGEIASRVRLAEELAPDLVAGEDRGEQAALQLVAAVGDERRAGVVDADTIQQLRRPRARELLVRDRLLTRRRVAAAVLARPEQSDVARVVEPPLPRAQERELLGQGGIVVRHARGACGPVLGEPRTQRRAKPRVVRRVREVHGAVYHHPRGRC